MAAFYGKPTMAAIIRMILETAALEEGAPGNRSGSAASETVHGDSSLRHNFSGAQNIASSSRKRKSGENADVIDAMQKIADSLNQPVHVEIRGSHEDIASNSPSKTLRLDASRRMTANELQASNAGTLTKLMETESLLEEEISDAVGLAESEFRVQSLRRRSQFIQDQIVAVMDSS
jgi:hypothetical protein